MRVVFVGTSELGIPALRALVESGRHQLLVLTKPDQMGGRGRRAIASPLKKAALDLGLVPGEPKDINSPSSLDSIREFGAEIIVVASYWAKLSDELLDIPPLGGVNIHPSLLPLYRGAAPIQHAILRGDGKTGITLFRMAKRMDAGEILAQEEHPIRPEDNYLTLHDRLAEVSALLLLQLLRDLEKGEITPRPQDESKAIFAPRFSKQDGGIDWGRSASEIERLVRAFTPWPGAFTYYTHRSSRVRLIITRSRVVLDVEPVSGNEPGRVVNNDKRIVIACGEGFVEVVRLKREGKKEMDGDSFLRGMTIQCGEIFHS